MKKNGSSILAFGLAIFFTVLALLFAIGCLSIFGGMKPASGDSGLGMVLVAFAIAMGGPIIELFLSVLGAITSFASVISAESKVIKRISIGLLIFNSVVAIGSLVMAISFNSFSFI